MAFVGTFFLNLLKFVVVPIVLTSIISRIVSLNDIKQVVSKQEDRRDAKLGIKGSGFAKSGDSQSAVKK